MSNPSQKNDDLCPQKELTSKRADSSTAVIGRPRHFGRTISLILASALLLLALGGQLGRFMPTLDFANALAPAAFILSFAMSLAGLRYNRTASILAAISLLLTGERVLPVWVEQPRVSSGQAGYAITLLTLNAWQHQDHPEQTAEALAASGVDIVLLQEAGPVLHIQDQRLQSAYPFRSDCPENCDLAILSKLPVRDFRYRLKDSNGKLVGPRIVFADLVPEAGRPSMTVASIHIDRNSQNGSSRAALDARLTDLFANMDRDDLVIGGDFNMTPYSFAFQNAARLLQPIRRVSAGTPSFPARLGGHSALPVFAIDHIFASPRWNAIPISPGDGFGSDHLPVAVRLQEADTR